MTSEPVSRFGSRLAIQPGLNPTDQVQQVLLPALSMKLEAGKPVGKAIGLAIGSFGATLQRKRTLATRPFNARQGNVEHT